MFDLLADKNVEIRADQKSFESYSKSPQNLDKLTKNSQPWCFGKIKFVKSINMS